MATLATKEYRYEMYNSVRKRKDTIQHIWGLSFQDKSDCEEVIILTTTLIQGMVGMPALLRIIQEKIGGPSLQTAYVTARSKFHTATKLEESTFVKAASFYDQIGYHRPFIITIDAAAILPCFREKGNKLKGIATEEDIVVRTAQDIIDITGNESMEKA